MRLTGHFIMHGYENVARNGRFFSLYNPSHLVSAVEYFQIFSWWFNTAYGIDTLDHYFVLNWTKLKMAMIKAEWMFMHPVQECGVVIMIIYGTDTNDWGKDVAIYVSDAKPCQVCAGLLLWHIIIIFNLQFNSTWICQIWQPFLHSVTYKYKLC